MSQYETIRVERDGPLARLTLDRPEQRNGMTNRMVRETFEALSDIGVDPSVRVVVVTGAGAHFCPGADLNWIGTSTDGDPLERCDREHFQVAAILHRMPQVTVAAINGACAGAGFGWACACDLRIAARSAMFNTAFLNVAVAGDMGLPWSLPRLIGAARARELSFVCEKFSADTAADVGLVARVFDDAAFADEREAFLTTLLERSPTALRLMKQHYVAAESMPFESYLALETEHHLDIAGGPHAAEAFRAFIEKRKPVFD